MQSIPLYAQKKSDNIARWANTPEKDIRDMLKNAAFLCGNYQEPKEILSISAPEKTLCGRTGQHILLKTDYREEEILFAKAQNTTILSPDGATYLGLDHTMAPIGEEWRSTRQSLWAKNQGSQKIAAIWECEELILSEDLVLWEKRNLSETFEETPAGKKEALQEKMRNLVWKGNKTIQAVIENAEQKQTAIFLRYLDKLAAQEKTERRKGNKLAVAQIRKKTNAAFPNLGNINHAVKEKLWEIQKEMPEITFDQEGESRALLDTTGNIHIHGPTNAKYAYSPEAFLKSREQLFSETNKTPPKKKEANPKTNSQKEQPTEKIPDRETPLRNVFCLEVETGIFATSIQSNTSNYGNYGAVSETGYHSQLPQKGTEEETLHNAYKTLCETPKNKTRSKNPSALIKLLSEKTIELVGKSELNALLLRETITEKTIYDAYHPLQAATDELLTVNALRLVESAQFELNPEVATTKLAEACKLINCIHAPSSQATPLKWEISRKIRRIGRQIQFSLEFEGPVKIQIAPQNETTWEERAHKSPACLTQWREPLLLLNWKNIQKEAPLQLWEPENPENIAKLLGIYLPPKEAPKKEAPKEPLQLSLF